MIKKAFSPTLFRDPPKENSTVYGWVWNAPITCEEIDRQLEEYKSAGITGLYILPLPPEFRPHILKTTMEPAYLSEDYFKCVKHALHKGKSLGMELWIYDEGGWPSGGACGHTFRENSAAAETLFEMREITLAAGENYIPSADAIVAFCNKQRVAAGFIASQETVIAEYYTSVCNDRHPNRVDSTNAEVIRTFIGNTYEPHYAAVGDLFDNGVSMIFTDEPSVQGRLVPENFFPLFREEYGYDAADYLYAIVDANKAETEAECRARIDYGRLVGKLFCNNFCRQLQGWCREKGIRFGGHLDLDHIPEGGACHGYFSHVSALRLFDVPGVDVIWEQIRYPYGGRKPVTEGAPFFPRLASSAARQGGNTRSLTETFGVYGDGVTPDEIRYALNYQAVRGINTFNFMTVPYGRKGLIGIGERPAFCPEKPGFFHLEHINRYFARLSYLLCLGDEVIDTALYHPSADFWANPTVASAAGAAYIQAGCELERQHIPFDIIDDDGILTAEVTDEGLKLGNAVYKHIVIPECQFIPEEVRQKAAPFCGKGTPILSTVSNGLQVAVRKLGKETLWFVFNEMEETVTETLNIPGEGLYRLDLLSGEIYAVNNTTVTIPCGEMVVLLSAEESKTVSADVDYTVTLSQKQFVAARQSELTTSGLTVQSVPEEAANASDFSGELTYHVPYTLPEEPQPADRFRLVLENTAVSARVEVGGRTVATLGMTPMAAILSGKVLAKAGELTITVANTFANELTAKQPLILSFPAAEIGPYNEMAQRFEQNKPLPKLGHVRLEKLK